MPFWAGSRWSCRLSINSATEQVYVYMLIFNSDVLHPNRANVSKDELRTKLSELYKSSKDQVSVFGFRTKYGGGKSTGFALIYDSVEALKKFEPHYRLVRIGAATKIEKPSRQQRTFEFSHIVVGQVTSTDIVSCEQASSARTKRRRYGVRPRRKVHQKTKARSNRGDGSWSTLCHVAEQPHVGAMLESACVVGGGHISWCIWERNRVHATASVNPLALNSKYYYLVYVCYISYVSYLFYRSKSRNPSSGILAAVGFTLLAASGSLVAVPYQLYRLTCLAQSSHLILCAARNRLSPFAIPTKHDAARLSPSHQRLTCNVT